LQRIPFKNLASVGGCLKSINQHRRRRFPLFLPTNYSEEPFLFDINEIVLTLKEIINIHRTNAAALLKQSIAILTKYSMDARFINNCNKHYLAIKEEMK